MSAIAAVANPRGMSCTDVGVGAFINYADNYPVLDDDIVGRLEVFDRLCDEGKRRSLEIGLTEEIFQEEMAKYYEEKRANSKK